MVEFQLPKLSTRVRFPSLAPGLSLKIKIFQYIAIFALTLVMFGCATTTELPTTTAQVPRGKGVYHKVHRGETVWRIADAYGVSIDSIIKSNRIPNVAQIEDNQLLFIPGAESVKEIVLDTEDLNKKEFIWPIKGKIISYFGERMGTQFNPGIAIQANPGDVVRAAREGDVVFADYLNGYAYTVILDHKDGYYSVYAKNSSLMVKLGDHVSKKDALAQVGKIGNLAFLHFEIRKHSVADNPLYYLP